MAVTYTPQYRVHGTTTWIAGTPTTGTSTVISGLSGSTIYDVEIVASSPAGTSTSSVVEATTPSGVSESPEAYTVTTAGPIVYASETMGVADPSGPWNQFVLVTSSADPPFQISLNGGAVVGGNVVSLVYHNHTLFQHAGVTGSFDGWWYWNTATSAYVAYDVTAIALSNSTVAASSPAGTVVGTLSATMSDSSTFSGTYSVSDTTNFKIVGANLETNVANLSGTFVITVTATPTLVGEAFTTPSGQISITAGSGSPQSYGTSAPATLPATVGAVSPLGWTVDYFDDFTSGTTSNVPNWGTGLQTGATYNGSPALYGISPNTTKGWGGYMGSQGGPAHCNVNNVYVSNSNLVCEATYDGTNINLGQYAFAWATPWGLWEASIKCSVGANGNNALLDNGWWFSGPSWPQAGEYDVFEDYWSTGWVTSIHCDTVVSGSRTAPGGSSSTLPDGQNWWTGPNYHTYGALLTPSYLATYIDGTLVFSTTSANCLNNITTSTNPPHATQAGSFGYLADTFVSTNIYQSWAMLGGIDFANGTTWNSGQFPMYQYTDWIRHSALYPATGGPAL